MSAADGLFWPAVFAAAWPARPLLLSQNCAGPGLTMTAEGPGWRGSRGQSGGRGSDRAAGAEPAPGAAEDTGHLLDGVVAPAQCLSH